MKAGDRVAIIAESRPEWLIVDLAVLAAGAVTVPIYPTLSALQVRYILQDSGARLAIVSTSCSSRRFRKSVTSCPPLEAVVVMDAATAGLTPSVVAFQTRRASVATAG